MSTPRGLRNNNPGNIRHGDTWIGLAEEQRDPEFCTFKDPKFGIRAMVKIFFRYDDLNIRTIRRIINRWAPPSENDTDSYVRDVARRCSVDPDDDIDVRSYRVVRPLVEAIIFHENGVQPYDNATLYAGIAMAGAKNMPDAPWALPEPAQPVSEKPGVWGFIKSLFGRS